jgi:hypothetical protein
MSKRVNTLRERNTEKEKTEQERKMYRVRGSEQSINKKHRERKRGDSESNTKRVKEGKQRKKQKDR